MKYSFNSAIEREVTEAVPINFEKRKGKILINSKSQYNRCSLPRISFNVGSGKPDESEDIESEEEKIVKDQIKEMRKRKGIEKMKRIAEEDAKKLLRGLALKFRILKTLKKKYIEKKR